MSGSSFNQISTSNGQKAASCVDKRRNDANIVSLSGRLLCPQQQVYMAWRIFSSEAGKPLALPDWVGLGRLCHICAIVGCFCLLSIINIAELTRCLPTVLCILAWLEQSYLNLTLTRSWLGGLSGKEIALIDHYRFHKHSPSYVKS